MKHDKDFNDMVTLYFYGELSDDEAKLFEEHLSTCSSCQGELSRLKMISGIISKTEKRAPTKVLLNRANMKVMEQITRTDTAPLLSGVKDRFDEFVDTVQLYFARPRYQLATIGIVFLVGIIVGKMWLSSGLLNDPNAFANFLNSKPKMSKVDESKLQNALASYLMQSGDVEVASLFQENEAESEEGIVEVNFRLEKDFALKGGLDDPGIQYMLRYSAVHDKSFERRMRAVRILGRAMPNKDVESTLIEVLESEESADIRLKAIETLCKSSSNEDIVSAFKSALLNDSEASVRLAALEYLGNIKDESLVSVITVVSVKDRDSTVKAKADKILRDINTENDGR